MPLDGRSGHEAAYDLLERAYRRTVGGPLPPVDKTEQGKPFFLRSGMQFSLTHTRTMVFCALSAQPVGIDAETIRPIRQRVALRTMNPEELAWLEAQPDRDRAFLTLWTAKEAWVKLTGEGLCWQPKRVELTFDGQTVGVRGQAATFAVRELSGVLVTACTRTPDEPKWTLLDPAPAES